MKKNYFICKCLALLLCGMVFKSAAQPLSGLYSINSAAATAGTNFASFTAFAAALNSGGVSGPVAVNVAPGSGPYVEQVSFIQPTGSSSANKITVDGNGNLITFNSTSSGSPWTIRLDGADNMTFSNLNVEATGTYAYALLLFNGANSNVFSNCSFSVSTTGSSTNQMPVVVSGSGTGYSTMGNSGNNNLWQACNMSGGYYGISFYGASTAPFNSDNKVMDCNIVDWYSRGISHYYYQKNYIFKGNLIERPNRTNSTTAYGIYSYYNEGTLIEGNRISRLFENMQTSTSTCYGMYIYWNYASSPKENPITVRNNIIADIKHNGSVYGMAAMYIDGYVHHNTISLDYTGSTGGTVYGLYVYAQNGKDMEVMNNMVSITKGGSGTKYGIYHAITGYLTADYNNYYVQSAGGTNYVGYYSGAQTSLASLQAASNNDLNSFNLNPNFASLATYDYMPTNAALNNQATPLGLFTDYNDAIRNQTTPDIGALEFLTPVCSGTPPSNSVSAPSYSVCPGEDVFLTLSSLNANSGFTYQWQSSTISNVGPFTPVTGANSFYYIAPTVTANTWYSVVMTCTTPGGGAVTPVGMVMVSGPVTSTIPYYESFENIGLPNRLPNCSWSATGIGTSNLTYTSSQSNNRVARTGSSYASFSNSSPGTSYFFTNAIQMTSGITYSAAIHYATEYLGYNNWTNLSILVGPNQNPTGMVQVASISPAMSGPYKLLDNTFTVPTSGQYYVAIMATGSAGNALFLNIDDLSITIPCEAGSPNSPTVTLSASNNTICAGTPVTFNAAGADTFSWSTGANGGTMTDNPTSNSTFYVYGTNTLTGCVSTVSQAIVVNPSPVVFAVPNTPVSCAGDEVIISGYGGLTYAWSNGGNGSQITVTPTVTTSYILVGINAFGCSGSYTQQITVNSLPNIAVVPNQAQEVCKDDQISFTATGAQNYIWVNNVTSQTYQGAVINITMASSGMFTVTGTDANGCSNKTTISQNVSECTGIAKNTAGAEINIFPNPNNGKVNVELNSSDIVNIQVLDVTGRIILEKTISENTQLDLSGAANGIYYMKIGSEATSKMIKLVKE